MANEWCDTLCILNAVRGSDAMHIGTTGEQPLSLPVGGSNQSITQVLSRFSLLHVNNMVLRTAMQQPTQKSALDACLY